LTKKLNKEKLLYLYVQLYSRLVVLHLKKIISALLQHGETSKHGNKLTNGLD
jgi:hypothetical protein